MTSALSRVPSRPRRRGLRASIATGSGLLLVAGGLNAPMVVPAAAAAPSAPQAAAAKPSYKITTVVSGLTNPWDVTFVGDQLLYNTRGGKIFSKRGSAKPKKLTLAKMPRLFVGSESGLMGMVADPRASKNKTFYTCQAVKKSGSNNPSDIRVLRWKLDNAAHATVNKTMVKGLPISSGRHGGCRLRFSKEGYLYVGTGDAARGANPQNLKSLGGKILRIAGNGSIPKDNPFYSKGGNARYVWNYGHRNVQGLALRPGVNQLWSVEQGTYRDDEINSVRRGANYGYNPLPGVYNESVPMTDTRKYPSARKARWSSGNPTIATSGATFLSGSKWGSWNGALAVGVLKGTEIKIFSVAKGGYTTKPLSEILIRNSNGDRRRIRTVQLGPDGALYFTTSDSSNDILGKITPR